MPFPYKRVLVVGATSGIGEALASRLVHEGSKVIVSGRRKEKLDAFVRDHSSHDDKTKETDKKAAGIPFDIMQLDQASTFAATVNSAFPDLDCVVLNSGIQRTVNFAKPREVDLDTIQTEITTNYTSYIALTKAFLPILMGKKDVPTAIVYVSSVLAIAPKIDHPNYCATKAALHNLVLALREQLKEFETLKVIELGPPAVQTELHNVQNQPNYGGNRDIGMPLDEFIDEAYAGLVSGKDEIFVGQGETMYDMVEPHRREAFKMMNGLK